MAGSKRVVSAQDCGATDMPAEWEIPVAAAGSGTPPPKLPPACRFTLAQSDLADNDCDNM
jgi:hypothetical protein